MNDPEDFNRTGRNAKTRERKKKRVTMYLDPAILEAYQALAADRGSGYQTLINEVLRQTICPELAPVTIASLRRVLREELSNCCRDKTQVADK